MPALPTALNTELSALLGDGWSVADADRHAHGTDNSRRTALPDAVAKPRTREQVQAIVRACIAHKVPIVARGSGTSSTGAALATRRCCWCPNRARR